MGQSTRLVKCPACEAMNPKNEAIEHNKRYYCQPCYAEKTKPKPRTTWDDLFDYIKQIYGKVPTGMMYKQLKQYREEYGYTDGGMFYTLKFMYEIEKLEVQQEAGLGLMVYYYDEARRYYAELFRLQQVRDAFEPHEEKRVVKVGQFEEPKRVQPFCFDLINWESDEDEAKSVNE